MKKLAIVITHPIQYYAPWFKLLASRGNVQLKVFYTWSQAADTVKDRTFGRDIKWDVPLLDGYEYEFIENVSKKPGSHHFFGIDCPELIAKLETYSPNAILFFGWNFKSHLKAMRYFQGRIPVWFRGDSTLLDEDGSYKTKLRRLVLKKVYSYVDKAFYVGQANKAYFLAHGLKENQLIHAPHAVNNAHFYDTNQHYDEQAAQWKQDIGLKTDTITVVFAGKFETKKQPDLLLDAVIEANNRRKDPLALVLIGNGPLEERLKLEVEPHDFITMLPFQNQSRMPLVYRMASIFCLPSKGPGETWGLAVNEAMASSRPVIVTEKVGGEKDMLMEGHNGYRFDHANRDALVDILVGLDKEALEVMGKNARAHIEKFTMLQIVEALEHAIYESA